jgi:hypothetical protein
MSKAPVKWLQPEKANMPIVFTELPMVKAPLKPLQFSKAC